LTYGDPRAANKEEVMVCQGEVGRGSLERIQQNMNTRTRWPEVIPSGPEELASLK